MRIDKYLAEKYGSRTKAANAVERGLVQVNGKTIPPSYEVKENDLLQFIEAEENYVSAGGFKLAKALSDFGYSPQGKVFADIGASTGGFTDCLFQHGARKVYCIDVGESQLDRSLREKNVIVIDNYNARNLVADLFSERLDGVVIDVSFISLTYILPAVSAVLDRGAVVLALIKPQFECEGGRVGKNGIVHDRNLRARAVKKVLDFAAVHDLAPRKITVAPIREGKNVEYVTMLEKGAVAEKTEKMLKAVNIN